MPEKHQIRKPKNIKFMIKSLYEIQINKLFHPKFQPNIFSSIFSDEILPALAWFIYYDNFPYDNNPDLFYSIRIKI